MRQAFPARSAGRRDEGPAAHTARSPEATQYLCSVESWPGAALSATVAVLVGLTAEITVRPEVRNSLPASTAVFPAGACASFAGRHGSPELNPLEEKWFRDLRTPEGGLSLKARANFPYNNEKVAHGFACLTEELVKPTARCFLAMRKLPCWTDKKSTSPACWHLAGQPANNRRGNPGPVPFPDLGLYLPGEAGEHSGIPFLTSSAAQVARTVTRLLPRRTPTWGDQAQPCRPQLVGKKSRR